MRHKLLKTIALAATCIGALAVPSMLAASNGPGQSTVLSPLVDGTVIDVNGDGAGDWTYDGFGSVVVGLSHPALGPGEDRGVFEFSLASLGRSCATSAVLSLNVAGSFSDFDFTSPNFTLYAAPADGVLTTADYSAIPIGYPTIYTDVAVDVTSAVRFAMNPALKTVGIENVGFVLAWNRPSTVGSAGLLFGTTELEQAYGDEYRSAKLEVRTTPGTCGPQD